MRNEWEIIRLGDICKTGAGGTPLKSKKEYYQGGTIPWLLSGEVSQGEIFSATNFITEKGLQNSSAKLFPKNTVLVAMYGATAGQVGILRFAASTNQAVCGILPNKSFIPEFLFYCFLLKKEELVSQAIGNAQPNISQEKIRNTLIPVPSLAEQKRILEILDKAFVAIDKAKANVEKNLTNAKELFESYLQNVFERLGDDVIEEKMVEACSILTCGVASTPKYVDSSVGVPFLSAQNVRNGKVILDKYQFISKEFHEQLTKKHKPRKGDILYSRVGAKFGEAAVVEHEFDFSVYVSLTFIRPIPEKLNSYYLKYYLNSPFIKSLAKKSISSSGVPNLNVKDVREFFVKYPSLIKQKQIVDEIDSLLAMSKKLEVLYQQKLDDLEELKKSILQKAFSGELTANEIMA